MRATTLPKIAESPAERPHLTVTEFAARERISRATAYNLIRDNQITTLKLGRLRRIPWASVIAYEESAKAQAAPQQA